MNEDHKEALLFHELGHCLLNRRHNDNTISGTNVRLSLMNTYMISSEEYKSRKSQYIHELFRPELYSQ